MTIQVKHTTSVQGPDDPSKSVNASEWNADHYVSGAVSVGAFDALSAAVLAVQANVSSLSVDSSVLDARVSTNSVFMAGISGGAGELHPTSAEWVSHLADDSALSVQVSNLSVQVGSLSAVVSSNAVQVSALSVAVSVVQANVSSLSVEVSVVRAGLSNEISARALSVNNLSAIVSSNAAVVSALSVAVSVIQANVSSLSVSLSIVQAGLSNELSARALSVNNLSAIVSTNLAQVSALSVLHSALSVQHSSLSALVSTLSVQHSSLSAQVSTLSVQHSSLSAVVSTVAANVSALSVSLSVLDARVSTNSVFMAGISGGAGETHPTSAEFVSLQADHSALSVQVSALSAQMTSLMATKTVLKGSQLISTSALANVSAMGLSVGAGNTYAFKYYVLYRSAAPASGLALSVTFPGMNTFAAMVCIPQGADGISMPFCGNILASGTKIQAISTPVSTTEFFATVEGACKVSTSGTLQLQASPEVSGAASQIIIKEGTAGAIWRTG